MIEIQRKDMLGSSLRALGAYGPNRLKNRVQVQFVSDQGVPEPGIDGGGLFKEFLEELCGIGFDPSTEGLGLFTATSAELLVPSPCAESIIGRDLALSYFHFMGRVLGKAVYERILVETEFSPVFLNILLGRLNQTDDLIHLDSSLHRSLMQLKQHMAIGGNIEELGLFFEVTRTSADGSISLIEVKSLSLHLSRNLSLSPIHLSILLFSSLFYSLNTHSLFHSLCLLSLILLPYTLTLPTYI